MNLFKLVGSIFIDNEKANESLGKTDEKANGIGETFAKGIKTVASWGVAVAAAAASAAIAIGVSAVNIAVDMEQATNSYIASTGASIEKTEDFERVLKNIYADNFGESLEDIANSMSAVTQMMGDLPDEELQKITEDAIVLRDTFGYDVAESVRNVKTLMDQFNISADEAFNLIAQGAQSGLDFSGELGDSINEYSVQFQKLGMDAQDMFNIFQSGAESGAFNLDKIGDAVKEFSIRAIDGSNTTVEGFQLIGMNADEMASKFAAGGDNAREAFQEVINGLASMNDPVQQSIAGVDLFGTMWEDLGPTVITNLDMVNGSIDATKDSMESLKEVKYDDLGSMLEGIKRNFEMMILPIGNEIIPVISTAIEQILPLMEANLPPIMEMVTSTIDTIVPLLLEIGQTAFPILIDAMNVFLPAALQLISMVLPNVLSLLTPLLDLLSPILSLLEPILDVLIALLEPSLLLMQPVIDLVAYLLQELLPPLTEALTWIADLITTYVSPAIADGISSNMDMITLFFDQFKILIDGVVTFISGTLDVIMGIVNVFIALFNGDFEAAGDALMQILNGLGNMIVGLLEAAFFNIIAVITNNLDDIKQFFSNFGSSIGNFFQKLWEDSISNATAKLNFLKDTISKVLEGAAVIVHAVIEKMKGFFDFEFQIPRIKLPHFQVVPTGWNMSDLLQGEIPKLDVEWYAKAMDNGMIMDKPTIFGINGNKLMGGGEAGSETVVGTMSLMEMIQAAVTSQNQQLIAILEQILKAIVRHDETLLDKMLTVLESMRFEIREREFARLVREVKA